MIASQPIEKKQQKAMRNLKATKNKNNTRTTALDRPVEKTAVCVRVCVCVWGGGWMWIMGCGLFGGRG